MCASRLLNILLKKREFLAQCERKSDRVCRNMFESCALTCLMPFLSRTSINGFLHRGILKGLFFFLLQHCNFPYFIYLMTFFLSFSFFVGGMHVLSAEQFRQHLAFPASPTLLDKKGAFGMCMNIVCVCVCVCVCGKKFLFLCPTASYAFCLYICFCLFPQTS